MYVPIDKECIAVGKRVGDCCTARCMPSISVGDVAVCTSVGLPGRVGGLQQTGAWGIRGTLRRHAQLAHHSWQHEEISSIQSSRHGLTEPTSTWHTLMAAVQHVCAQILLRPQLKYVLPLNRGGHLHPHATCGTQCLAVSASHHQGTIACIHQQRTRELRCQLLSQAHQGSV